MSLQTRLTVRFGIKHPIISAPMGTIAGGRLAGAVSPLVKTASCLPDRLEAARRHHGRPVARQGSIFVKNSSKRARLRRPRNTVTPLRVDPVHLGG
jgi:hypothetical protein